VPRRALRSVSVARIRALQAEGHAAARGATGENLALGGVDWERVQPGAVLELGDKVRIDINAQPVFIFKQVYDGQRSVSNIPGVEVPPPSKFGLPVLGKFDQPGYTVTALPDKKKLRGFRIADSEGNTTDYYIDPATAQVSEFVIPYNGFTFGSSISKFKEYDGVLIPTNFTQRFELPGAGAYFAEYKVKDIKLNQPVGDDVFVIQ